jgi:hypothetical protein
VTKQGALTEGKGTVQLTSLKKCLKQNRKIWFQYEKQLISTRKFKEVKCTDPTPSVRIPWSTKWNKFFIDFLRKYLRNFSSECFAPIFKKKVFKKSCKESFLRSLVRMHPEALVKNHAF